jgi:alginate O-acetyltransferase complex protein AlgI
LLLGLAVVLNLGMLAVFKYAGMVAASVFGAYAQLTGGLALDPPLVEILLPIGISFYTFQALSYVIDVYRGQVAAQRNYLNILLYIAFFPQLIAGPIVKYHDIAAQLRQRVVNAGRAAQGFRRFCVGLAKKVLIANTVALGVDALFAAPAGEVNAAVAWLAALGYMLQIYYDFSGYSDMAIGMGRMFGFEFKENFCYPYGATSIKEFWRRWHISLSTWFKEYLYIPLGGNRRGRARTSLNKIVVFFCTGLWHGANWTFVVWGLWHGLFLLLEDYLPIKKLPRLLGHIYALLVVCLGFVLFRAADFGQAALFIGQMFTGWWQTPAAATLTLSQLNPLFIVAFVAGVLGAFGLPNLLRKILGREPGANGAQTPAPQASGVAVLRIASYLGSLALLAICLLFLASGGYNPFIYFRF